VLVLLQFYEPFRVAVRITVLWTYLNYQDVQATEKQKDKKGSDESSSEEESSEDEKTKKSDDDVVKRQFLVRYVVHQVSK